MLNRILTPKSLVAATAAAALALPAATASAEFEQEDWELRLSGFSQSDVNLDGTNISFSGSAGYFFSDQAEGGLRQDISYSDLGGSAFNGSTAVFINYHFGGQGEQLQPFIGGNLGYSYGDTTHDTFFAGPEGGVKYFVNEDWFVFLQGEYQFFFEDAGDADEGFDDGIFVFRLGLGVLL